MDYLEFEKVDSPNDYAMNEPHSHEHFELYFLLDGTRNFFIDDKMFVVNKNAFIVVPPFSMHKTEGGPYVRININVSPSLLSPEQDEILRKIASKIAIHLHGKYLNLIKELLIEGESIQSMNLKNKNDYLLSILKTIILFLSIENFKSISAASVADNVRNATPEVLKIIYFINTNYSQKITLEMLCNEFFLSKVSLCKKFKEVMNCSIMEYVLRLRLNIAKSLLRDSTKSIEEISAECGFSSANYFGLIFKKEVGLSPLNYKKTR
ncbi:MAG: helix-turn-helix domain-containing protein [Clostridia bacterium]|nr:helix-turn-helix domain-containing protein [Clostridia bacterium]